VRYDLATEGVFTFRVDAAVVTDAANSPNLPVRKQPGVVEQRWKKYPSYAILLVFDDGMKCR
jgi:hypothetical protein